MLQIHAKEAILSAHISHHNILPFYGVYLAGKASRRVCIISPWMDNGDLLNYLERAPATPRFPLVCFTLRNTAFVLHPTLMLSRYQMLHQDLSIYMKLTSYTLT
jgi:serine/threonine protein kinase